MPIPVCLPEVAGELTLFSTDSYVGATSLGDCRMGSFRFFGLPVIVLATALFFPAGGADASGYKVLHAFSGTDGAGPTSALIRDANGNLYGTTHDGISGGWGTIFKLAPDGTETVLHVLDGDNDGGLPYAGVIADGEGNLYGAASSLGPGGNQSQGGTIFRITPDGTFTVLYAFVGGATGSYPVGDLVFANGSLYGTAGNDGAHGCGVVYKVTTGGTYSVVYSFKGGSDGCEPLARLGADDQGVLYGDTFAGGTSNCGTVFRVTPDGAETVLHQFKCGRDGAYPQSGVIADSAGNLYGTTVNGGSRRDCGTIYRLEPDGKKTTLHVFRCKRDGGYPRDKLLLDQAGNLYGTAGLGGHGSDGVVFKLAADGSYSVIHGFGRGKHSDGTNPWDGLLLSDGHFYGTAAGGTDGETQYGIVFRLKYQ